MKNFAYGLICATAISTAALAAPMPSVVTGGVGESSREAIEQVQNNYNVKLVFTGNEGKYLADVAVSIRDKDGNEVVSGLSQGPLLLAELAPGRYTVEASSEGYTKKQVITVSSAMKTFQMSFPIADDIERTAGLEQR